MATPVIHDVFFRSPVEIEAALENQVSKGGWFIVCDAPEARGVSIQLRFHLPGLAGPLEVLGEVAFAAPKSAPVPGLGSGMAVQFAKLSPQVLKAFAAAATIARSEASQPRPAMSAPVAAPAPVPAPAPRVEPSAIPVSAPASITEKVSATATAAPAPAAVKPAPAGGTPIGKIKLNLGNGSGPAAPTAPDPTAPAAADPGAEWTEEPDENWPGGPGEADAALGAEDEDSLEDTGPADGDVTEPDESQQRKILARINTQNTENLYGTLRQMPFHHKVVAAKRGNRSVRAILIQEGNQKILNFLLQNPQVSVPEVMNILKLGTVAYDVIQTISKNQAWMSSEEVRYLMITHPKTPLPLALTILPNLNVNSLAKLAKLGACKPQVKSTALKLLEQRRKSG